NAKCVSTGPVVEAVRVTDNATPGLNGFFARSAANSIPVSVDVSPGFGGQIASVFLTVNGNRIDLTNSSTAGTVTTYNFTVPTVDAPAGTDGAFLFQVTATDASGNQTQVTPTSGLKIDDAGPVVRGVASEVLAHAQTGESGCNVSTGQVGIDGKAPTINLTISASGTPVNYPPVNADCDADSTLYCGHDGTHFWRRGIGVNGAETSSISFTLTEGGSGVDPANPTCGIDGVTGCAVTSSSGTFSFTPNFTTATLGSAEIGTGGGLATVRVNATDRVGNAAPAKVQFAQVSRIRWVQKLTSRTQGVSVLRGSPVVTAVPVPQIIVGGTR